jgi:hypothetical protein
VQRDGGGNHIELVNLKIRLGCIDNSQRAARMPPDIRGALATLMVN